MRITLLFLIFLGCTGLTLSIAPIIPIIAKGITVFITAVQVIEKIHSLNEMFFEEEVVPVVDHILQDLKKEFDYSMPDILKAAVISDYERDIEMPTHTLFRSIEIFFHNQSETSLTDMKQICVQNHPLSVLLNFQYKLEKEDSTYYKHLKLFNFKSEYANLFVKKFEGVVSKLMFSYAFCQVFLTNNTIQSVKHMEQATESVLTLIWKQRKEVPNMIPPESIRRHIIESNAEKCSEEAQFLVDKCDIELYCPVPAGRKSDGCVRKFSTKRTFTSYTNEQCLAAEKCINNMTKNIFNNLIENYNYDKRWIVQASLDRYVGTKKNVAEFEIGHLKMLVYYSNPVKNYTYMPLEDIKEKLIFKGTRSSCPYLLEGEDHLHRRFIEMLKFNHYCENRSLCVVSTKRGASRWAHFDTIDRSTIAPCKDNHFLNIFMGPESSQEEEYPSGDEFDNENSFNWFHNFTQKMTNLQQTYEEELRREQEAKEREEKLRREQEAKEREEKLRKENEIVSILKEALENIKKQPHYNITTTYKSGLVNDFKKTVETPTHALLHSIEQYFHNQTESSLAHMKKICEKYPPLDILLSFRSELDKPKSIYYKYLDLANFKSEPANFVMKKFEGIATKLMLFHEICRNFSMPSIDESAEHVKVAQSILTLVRKQRKEVPNIIPPESIRRHISESNTEKCSEAQFLVDECILELRCPVPAGRASNGCTKYFPTKRILASYNTKQCLASIDCIQNMTENIFNNLVENYNYDKRWLIQISLDRYVGTKKNVAEFEIGHLKVLVYFSNAVKGSVSMPLENIKEKLIFKSTSSSGSSCPYSSEGEDHLHKKFYDKLKSNNYCRNRSLCVVSTKHGSFGWKHSGNIDVSYIAPCKDNHFLNIIMGPESDQEEEYPSGDKFDNESPFKQFTVLEKQITKLYNEHKENMVLTKNNSSLCHSYGFVENIFIFISCWLLLSEYIF